MPGSDMRGELLPENLRFFRSLGFCAGCALPLLPLFIKWACTRLQTDRSFARCPVGAPDGLAWMRELMPIAFFLFFDRIVKFSVRLDANLDGHIVPSSLVHFDCGRSVDFTRLEVRVTLSLSLPAEQAGYSPWGHRNSRVLRRTGFLSVRRRETLIRHRLP